MNLARKALFSIVCTLLASPFVFTQSRHSAKGIDVEGAILSVTVSREDKKSDPIKIDTLHLYENAIEQKIKNFSLDPSPARIVILVDNSQTVGASLEDLKSAVMQFAYEIFEGDQLFVIAYDEKPEIIQEWTDDAKKMEASLGTLRKKGNPHLFDAINTSLKEVLLPLMPGTRKTAIVLIGDGVDRGSSTQYDRLLGELQTQNITL